MKIKITANTLFYLLNKNFSLEACEAICEFYEECEKEVEIPSPGDISIAYCEVPSDEVEEDDFIMAELSNGCTLIAR